MMDQPLQQEDQEPEFDIEKYKKELSEEEILVEWKKEDRRLLRELLSNRVIRSILADQKMRLELARRKAQAMPMNSMDDLVKAAAPKNFADGIEFVFESFLAPTNFGLESPESEPVKREAAP